MRNLRTIQTSFSGGELDEGLAARIEVSKYFSGCRRVRNALPLPKGGFRRRPGMRQVRQLAGGTDGVA